jgi:hypothetical protein
LLARENTLWSRAGRLLGRHKIALVLGTAFLAAVATGAVRVQWSGLAYFAVGLVLLGLWRAATDRRLGSRVIEFYSSAPLLGVFSIAAIALTFSGIYLLSTRLPPPVPWFSERWLFSIVTSATVLLFLMVIGSWFFGRRRAGDLLLEVKVHIPYGRWLLVCGAVNSVLSAVQLSVHLWEGRAADPYEVLYFTGCVTPTLFWIVALRPLEIRERGLIIGGQLIPWVNVRGYSWEPYSDPWGLTQLRINPEREVMKLDIRRVFDFLPPIGIQIARDHRPAVEAIMSRHLSPWPQ